jgi:hypothetical protein
MLTGCSNSVSHAFTTQTTTTQAAPVTTPVLPVTPAPPIAFTGVGFDLFAAGDVHPGASDAAWAGVLDTLNRYLDAGVLTPLRTGGPAGDLTPLFTQPAVARVMSDTPDRTAFIDENLPPVADLRQEAAVASLAGLADIDGDMSVVTAGLDLRLIGHVAGAPVTVERTGELVLVPEGDTWRIDAYDLKVVRTRAEDTTATTVRS